MKLLINTESLKPPLTGIGNYTLNLLLQFRALGGFDAIDCIEGHRLRPLSQVLATQQSSSHAEAGKRRPPGGLRELARGMPLAYNAREIWRNSALRLKAGSLAGHVYHEPNFILKPHRGPAVATIHDLSFVHHPQFHPRRRVAWLSSQLPRTLARADALITDSELVRRELIEHYRVNPDKVHAIHLGAAAAFCPHTPEQTAPVLNRHNLQHGQYLLFVGSLEPRKGVDVLLDAWASLPAELQQAFPLVLAGAPGWNNQPLLAQMAKLAGRGLRHLHFVPGEDLPALYAAAKVFVYPSYYEGFGLPVLEAMQCGTAVICTAQTAMAEFAGDGAQLFPAGDARQLAAELEKLLVDNSRHAALASAGLAQAQGFSWRRCAEQTQAVYRSIS